MDILFFSRGRGRGHAIPDAAIVREMWEIERGLEITFASYGLGAETLRSEGFPVIDLGLPEDNAFVSTLLKISELITKSRPRLVVSHEEYPALPAARLNKIPAVFVADWFPPDRSLMAECLKCADRIIFIDNPGIYDVPTEVMDRVVYVGPALRRLRFNSSFRKEIRRSLGLSDNSRIILVVPGGASTSTEERAPLFQLVSSAVDLVQERDKLILWVADAEEQRRLRMNSGRLSFPVHFKSPHLDIDSTIVASNLGITKANRITCHEFSALGVPSISISYGLNPIDDYRVSLMRNNKYLRARGLTPQILAGEIERALRAGTCQNSLSPNETGAGRIAAARELLAVLCPRDKTTVPVRNE